MLIALTKLADIAARSLFVLLSQYALPIRSTGPFGQALTLLGFFTFVSGFERYADLQRRMVGTDEAQTDRLILSTLRFYAVNYLLCVPVLLALLLLWVQLPPWLALMCVVVGVGEHLSNEVYRIALIAPRHRPVLFAVLGKNITLLAIVAAVLWQRPALFSLDLLLGTWALLSLAGIGVIAVAFTRTWAFTSFSEATGAGLRQRRQYLASRTHFLIGLVALTSLQADRLVAGALLTLEQSGVYFRHIFLASFAYQVFNVASYNRIAPQVYEHTHAHHSALARAVIGREVKRLVPAAALAVSAFYLVCSPLFDGVSATRTINPNFLAVLTLGYLVRAFADFNALLLNGVYAERAVFTSQLTALGLAVVMNVMLTHFFGIPGTVATLVLGAAAYFIASSLSIRKNPSLNGLVAP